MSIKAMTSVVACRHSPALTQSECRRPSTLLVHCAVRPRSGASLAQQADCPVRKADEQCVSGSLHSFSSYGCCKKLVVPLCRLDMKLGTSCCWDEQLHEARKMGIPPPPSIRSLQCCTDPHRVLLASH